MNDSINSSFHTHLLSFVFRVSVSGTGFGGNVMSDSPKVIHLFQGLLDEFFPADYNEMNSCIIYICK